LRRIWGLYCGLARAAGKANEGNTGESLGGMAREELAIEGILLVGLTQFCGRVDRAEFFS
jgi:hypothetical protein